MTSSCLILGRIFLKEKIPNSFIAAALICLLGLSLNIYGLVTSVLQEKYTDANSYKHEATTLSHLVINNQTPIDAQNIFPEPYGGRNIHTGTVSKLLIGFAVAMLSGVSEAVSVVVQKYYEDEFSSVHILTFWSSLSGIVMSVFILLVFQYSYIAIPNDTETCFLVLGQALVVGVGFTLYIISMKVASTFVVSIFHNAHIPTAVLFETFWFGNLQPIRGSIYDLIGPIIVTIGLVIPPIWASIEAILHRIKSRSTASARLSDTQTLLHRQTNTLD